MNLIKGLKRQWLLVAMVLAVYCQFSTNQYLLNVSKSGIWFAFVFNGFVLPIMYLGLTCFFLYAYSMFKKLFDETELNGEWDDLGEEFKKKFLAKEGNFNKYQDFREKTRNAGEVDYIGRVLSILLLVGLAVSSHTFIAAWTIAAYLMMVGCTMVIKNTSKEFKAICDRLKLDKYFAEFEAESKQNQPVVA